ncbi:MAG: leucine-rich repeat domain-containing protein, partial [Ruminococcus sp.]|nr:leucine-rich repeat domain-containing protein [Ruminococcus sp.]
MKNKILAGIMALCLVGSVVVIPESITSLVSITANADSTYNDFKYVLNTDKTAVKITKYTGLDAEVVIPAEIDGLPVTYIGDDAFKNNKGLASVVIPDSVTVIGWGSFSDCTALTSV